ncbi:PEP-CTERM sorting domain-containing protein [Actibacterium lipolyticum]|uniref:VPLPA-CTERM sorting domain-containing protein n=1 Tax=Actibacterium lipolyticum TaxID=1524263 RepID=A0A238JK55_9RHOB|nr:PEP-CTERM sorting domain-containing protein [Actibacterium lipolyticum]SMX30783.1 hypothetical protein COL8621_00118 [Actibacterium lipolyticum]
MATDISGAAADGFLTLTFQGTSEINFTNGGTGVFASLPAFYIAVAGELTYETATVPLPATLPLLGGSLGLFGLWSRRKAKSQG